MFAIDAQLDPHEPGGTETVLTLQLEALAHHSKERFLVLGSVDHDEDWRPLLGRNMELLPYPIRYSWLKPGAPPLSAAASDALLHAHGVRVVHFPYPQHFSTDLPFVYEPWGLPHRHFPEMFQPGEPEWMDVLMREGCEKASLVITGTRWAAHDIARTYDLPLSKFVVLPRNPIQHADGAKQDMRQERTGDAFALYPSVAWPHKNHINLLRALALLRDEHRLTLRLVCTGKFDTPAEASIREAIAELHLGDQVQFTGQIPKASLEHLFRTASFLVHPSRFEGLGLPLIEAMSYDLPVLASTATCIPEVMGDAAILFDPESPADIAAAMKTAIESPRLLLDLRAKARRRLKSFFPSRRKLADSFVATYKAAGGLELTDEERARLAEIRL